MNDDPGEEKDDKLHDDIDTAEVIEVTHVSHPTSMAGPSREQSPLHVLPEIPSASAQPQRVERPKPSANSSQLSPPNYLRLRPSKSLGTIHDTDSSTIHPATSTTHRRPSLEFLKLQREETPKARAPSLVLPAIRTVSSSIFNTGSEEEEDRSANRFEATFRSKSPLRDERLGTSSSFLLGRTTRSGSIKFSTTRKPSEEVLRRRLDKLDVSDIDELIDHNEDARTLSPTSRHSSLTGAEELVTNPGMTEDNLKMEIGSELPDIEGLRMAIDLLSMDKIHKVYDQCKMQDNPKNGKIAASHVLKAFIDVVPGASRRNSIWRKLVIRLAPNDEQIAYGKLLRAISKIKTGSAEDDTLPTIADLLFSQEGLTMMATELPQRPSTSQMIKEKGRAQILIEIETLLTRNPQLDIMRLQLATSQKTIDANELVMILEVHGLEPFFRPFLSRLLSCFRTNDNKFHFAAFAGCLDHVQPVGRGSAPAVMATRVWEGDPLGPITPTEDRLFFEDD